MVALLAKCYSVLQFLHGFWRWAVLIAAVLSIAAGIRGLVGRAPAIRRTSAIYVAAVDLQFLLGLLLYAASPIVASAWMNISAAMKVQELRFFSVEHPTAMLLAVVFAHVGSIRAKRAATERARCARIVLWHALSLAAILIGIPWWRPLLRLP